MIFNEDKYRFMSAAIKEAGKAFEQNEVPIGAVVVHENKIIGRGYNRVENLNDATAHAEILAITAASNHLESWRLTECDLYVTVEPCVMCIGAILLSRIKNIYFGIFDPKFGACGTVYNIAQESKLNHKVNVYSGLLSDECQLLMQEFFKQKRKTKTKITHK
jgi:tRNA(adenine34) deaminase